MTQIICNLLTLYIFILLARIVLSYFPRTNPDGAVATFEGLLHLLTEPVLGPLRRTIPPVRLGAMAIDLSPIIVFVGIRVFQGLVLGC